MKICLQCQHVFCSHDWTCPACNYQPIQQDGYVAHSPALAFEGSGFKSEYFAPLAKLEAANFWFVARNQLILWALQTYSPDAKTFLEVGCGTGFVLSGIAKAIPEISLYGSEIFLAGLSHAAARVPRANFMQMDARRVPFAEEFDAIGAFDVLEHIDEDLSVLAQLYRALKPGGTLLLTVPQHPWLWSSSDDRACHVRRYTAVGLHEKLKQAGFCIGRSTSFVSLLLPAMLLSRRRSQYKAVEDPSEELRLPQWLNTIFLAAMRLEQMLIGQGVNFPLGGSRLIVARKADN